MSGYFSSPALYARTMEPESSQNMGAEPNTATADLNPNLAGTSACREVFEAFELTARGLDADRALDLGVAEREAFAGVDRVVGVLERPRAGIVLEDGGGRGEGVCGVLHRLLAGRI